MSKKLKIKPKSYTIISDLTEKQLSEFGINRDQIDAVVKFQFDFVKEFFENPVKGKLYIHELGNFVIHAKAVIGFLRSSIKTFRKRKKAGEPLGDELVESFRNRWKHRHVATEYVANYSRRDVKGFYKPFNIKKKIYIPKQ